MAIISVESTQTFRQMRAAVFGISIFLRLAWAFILALNVFSLTTRIDRVHQTNAIYLFAVDIFALIVIAAIGGIEVGRLSIASKTSQVLFEFCWMLAFLVLETVGAVMFTILRLFFECENIDSSSGANPGATRKATPQEVATCQLSNKLVFFGAWALIGFSLLYIVYFFSLSVVASRRDRSVWFSATFQFDWSITSQPTPANDRPDPSLIRRPSNPQMSKAVMDSSLSLPFAYQRQPFQPSTDSFGSAKGPALNRHQIMAQYQYDDISIRTPSPGPGLDDQLRNFRFSALGLDIESMTPVAPTFKKHRPSLSITIPPQEIPDVIPVHVAQRDPLEEIGYSAMGMPFSGLSSSDCSGESALSLSRDAVSSTNAIGSHVSLRAVQSYKMSKAKHRGVEVSSDESSPDVQSKAASRNYPTINQSVYRQSTLLNSGSMPPNRRVPSQLTMPAPLAPTAQRTSNLLPLHQGDVRSSQYAPYSTSSHQTSGDRVIVNGSIFEMYNPPPRVPIRSSNTWPLQSRQPHYYHKRQVASTDVDMNTGIPFTVPPPPDHSPPEVPLSVTDESRQVSASPSAFPSGKVSHSRSASSPIFYYQPHGTTGATHSRQSSESGPRSSLVRAPTYTYSGYRSRYESPFPFLDPNTIGSRAVSPVASPADDLGSSKRRRSKLQKADPNLRRF